MMHNTTRQTQTGTDMTENTSTLQIRGITRFSMTPRWIARAGKALSPNAKALYTIIMSYADNDTRTAFPGHELLAKDLGVSVSTVHRAMKELEAFGAITVLRRRNQKTGNFYSNQYTLIFDEPQTPSVTSENGGMSPVTEEVDSTSLTRPSSYFTSEVSSDCEFHAHAPREALKKDPLPVNHYIETKRLLIRVGQAIQETGSFNSYEAQTAWDVFAGTLVAYTEHLDYHHALADLLLNGKWTVTADVADGYRAGKEITTMLNTARTQDG